jgi:aminoglycoside phosphotransferase
MQQKKFISGEQKLLSTFKDKGFVVLEKVLSQNMINLISEALIAEVVADENSSLSKPYSVGDNRKMFSIYLKSPFDNPSFYANPLLMRVMKKLLGREFILNSLGVVIAKPGAKAQHVHQDHPPLFDSDEENTQISCYAITILIPLVDLNYENGALQVWEKSHIPGYNPNEHKPKTVNISAGDCVLFDYRLYHRGTATIGKQERPVLYLVYSRPWFRDSVNFLSHSPLSIIDSVYNKIPTQYKPLFRFSDLINDTPISNFDIGERRLIKLFENIFPGERVSKIESRKQLPSFHHKIELIRIQFSPQSKPTYSLNVCVRVYLGRLCWWVLDAPDIPEREYTAWNIATRAHIPLARKYRCYKTKQGQNFAVLEGIKGDALWHSASMNAIQDTAQILARLHAITPKDEEKTRLPDVRVNNIIKRLHQWSHEISDDKISRIIDIVKQQQSSIVERPGVVLHGDFHPGNLLVAKEKVVALLDWESCAIGDPRIDLATMYSCLKNRYNSALADQFITIYENESGWTIGNLKAWKDLLDVRDAVLTLLIKKLIENGVELPTTQINAWLAFGQNSLKRVQSLLTEYA